VAAAREQLMLIISYCKLIVSASYQDERSSSDLSGNTDITDGSFAQGINGRPARRLYHVDIKPAARQTN